MRVAAVRAFALSPGKGLSAANFNRLWKRFRSASENPELIFQSPGETEFSAVRSALLLRVQPNPTLGPTGYFPSPRLKVSLLRRQPYCIFAGGAI